MKVRVKHNVTKELLESVGFQMESGVWTYRRNVYENSIEMLVRIWLPDEEDDSYSSSITIVEKGTNNVYASYYNDSPSKNLIIDIVRKNVEASTRFLVHKGIFAVVDKKKTYFRRR